MVLDSQGARLALDNFPDNGGKQRCGGRCGKGITSIGRQGDEKPAGRLRIGQQSPSRLVGTVEIQSVHEVFEVCPGSAGAKSAARIRERSGQKRYSTRADARCNAGRGTEIGEVTRQPEPTDIGGSVRSARHHPVCCFSIKRRHPANCLHDIPLVGGFCLDSRPDDARANGLGQDEKIARLSPSRRHDAARIHRSRDSQTVLGLLVVDGMTAHDGHARFPGLVGAATQDRHEEIKWMGADRKADDVECCAGPAPQRVHIAEGVGSSNLPKQVGVVDDGCKEVHRLDEGKIVRQPVDGGVVGGMVADQQIGIGSGGELTQHVRQVSSADFAGSPRAAHKRRQTNVLVHCTPPFPESLPGGSALWSEPLDQSLDQFLAAKPDGIGRRKPG